MSETIHDFLPYLLNQAAEAAGLDFQPHYRDRYGMLRTEWRVLFHLGSLGPLTAKDICMRARIHKTKVSRAVRALELKRFLIRETDDSDRRHEILTLTRAGQVAFADLTERAWDYESRLTSEFSSSEIEQLKSTLKRLMAYGSKPGPPERDTVE